MRHVVVKRPSVGPAVALTIIILLLGFVLTSCVLRVMAGYGGSLQ